MRDYKVIIDLLGVMHQTMSAVHGNGGTHCGYPGGPMTLLYSKEVTRRPSVTSDQQEPSYSRWNLLQHVHEVLSNFHGFKILTGGIRVPDGPKLQGVLGPPRYPQGV